MVWKWKCYGLTRTDLRKWNWKWKMEDANERWNNGNEKRDEMENFQAMLRLLSKSLYGLVSEIMQKLTKNNLYW